MSNSNEDSVFLIKSNIVYIVNFNVQFQFKFFNVGWFKFFKKWIKGHFIAVFLLITMFLTIPLII